MLSGDGLRLYKLALVGSNMQIYSRHINIPDDTREDTPTRVGLRILLNCLPNFCQTRQRKQQSPRFLNLQLWRLLVYPSSDLPIAPLIVEIIGVRGHICGGHEPSRFEGSAGRPSKHVCRKIGAEHPCNRENNSGEHKGGGTEYRRRDISGFERLQLRPQ